MTFNNRYNKYVGKYEENQKIYDKTQSNDLENVAKDLIETAEKNQMILEKDPKVLKEIIGNDIRETVTPQLFSVIAEIVKLINTLENDEDDHESK